MGLFGIKAKNVNAGYSDICIGVAVLLIIALVEIRWRLVKNKATKLLEEDEKVGLLNIFQWGDPGYHVRYPLRPQSHFLNLGAFILAVIFAVTKAWPIG